MLTDINHHYLTINTITFPICAVSVILENWQCVPQIRPLRTKCVCVFSGGYNLQDVVFYWTRGNDSVKGLDTLRLAQYSVESYHTTVSEAVYETGRTNTTTPLTQ